MLNPHFEVTDPSDAAFRFMHQWIDNGGWVAMRNLEGVCVVIADSRTGKNGWHGIIGRLDRHLQVNHQVARDPL